MRTINKNIVIVVSGFVWLTVVAISWFVFPGWQKIPGGLLILFGVATVGVVSVTAGLISIRKDLIVEKDRVGQSFPSLNAEKVEASSIEQKTTTIGHTEMIISIAKGDRSVAHSGSGNNININTGDQNK